MLTVVGTVFMCFVERGLREEADLSAMKNNVCEGLEFPLFDSEYIYNMI